MEWELDPVNYLLGSTTTFLLVGFWSDDMTYYQHQFASYIGPALDGGLTYRFLVDSAEESARFFKISAVYPSTLPPLPFP